MLHAILCICFFMQIWLCNMKIYIVSLIKDFYTTYTYIVQQICTSFIYDTLNFHFLTDLSSRVKLLFNRYLFPDICRCWFSTRIYIFFKITWFVKICSDAFQKCVYPPISNISAATRKNEETCWPLLIVKSKWLAFKRLDRPASTPQLHTKTVLTYQCVAATTGCPLLLL